MRCLERNKTTVYYANLLGVEDAIDDDGNYTGETETVYEDPKPLKINVSVPNGQVSTQLFTMLNDYDRVLVTDETELDIDNNTVFWIGVECTEPYNYVVKGIHESLNVLSLAVKEVKVNG